MSEWVSHYLVCRVYLGYFRKLKTRVLITWADTEPGTDAEPNQSGKQAAQFSRQILKYKDFCSFKIITESGDQYLLQKYWPFNSKRQQSKENH